MAVATYISLDELLNCWPCPNYDPLDDEKLREKRETVIFFFVRHRECALGMLSKFTLRLQKYNVSTLHPLFPEKDFNVLTLVEYALHYAVFTLDEPKEFEEFENNEEYKYNFLLVMETLENILTDLKTLLQSEFRLDEDQALRVAAHSKKIMDCYRSWEQDKREQSFNAELGAPALWQPFFSEHFPTREENIFMTQLREIYIKSRTTNAVEIFKSLTDLSQSADMETVLSSDVMTNTAMRMVTSSVIQVIDNEGPKGLRIELRNLMLRNFSLLSMTSSPHFSHSFSFWQLAQERIRAFHALINRPVFWPGSSMLEDCKFPGLTSSALWQKLRAPGFAKKCEETNPVINYVMCNNHCNARTNFTIFDSCDHLYCVDCFSIWLNEEQHSTCPVCGVLINEWTTRDLFLASPLIRTRSKRSGQSASTIG